MPQVHSFYANVLVNKHTDLAKASPLLLLRLVPVLHEVFGELVQAFHKRIPVWFLGRMTRPAWSIVGLGGFHNSPRFEIASLSPYMFVGGTPRNDSQQQGIDCRAKKRKRKTGKNIWLWETPEVRWHHPRESFPILFDSPSSNVFSRRR